MHVMSVSMSAVSLSIDSVNCRRDLQGRAPGYFLLPSTERLLLHIHPPTGALAVDVPLGWKLL